MNLSLLRKAIRRPGAAWQYGTGLLKGYWYKAWLPLTGRRFRAGRNFRVYGRLVVRGPGRVEFGDGVTIWGIVTPYTHSADAVISVGDETVLSGTRFGCKTGITIGRDGIIADCRIFDTDFHSIHVNRHEDDAPVRVAPVEIEDNVWVASQAALMPGTVIRENSVVGFGAVCSGGFPPNALVVGNPARVGGRVPGTENLIGPARPVAPSQRAASAPTVTSPHPADAPPPMHDRHP
jgi:acetyltransferase-like isoleucine patch superfamily enzyme